MTTTNARPQIHRFSFGTARRVWAIPIMIVLIGATGFLLSVEGTASAYTYGQPTITGAKATFKIPAGTEATWTLELWSHGTMDGSAMGTSGTLTVLVPATSDCAFQADVRAFAADGHRFYFAGTRARVPGCGAGNRGQTISGHIYLCTAGSPTTTEVSGGTLAATGPTALVTQPNPVTPTAVTAGAYTMSAGAPDGFTLVLCSGSATITAGGQTAAQSVTVASGGAGAGLFYVTGPPVAAGGGTGGSGGGVPTGSAVVAASSSASVQAAATASGAATPASGAQLAFTGMETTRPLALGLILIALGTMLVIFSRARRVPHPRPARAGAATPPVPRRP